MPGAPSISTVRAVAPLASTVIWSLVRGVFFRLCLASVGSGLYYRATDRGGTLAVTCLLHSFPCGPGPD